MGAGGGDSGGDAGEEHDDQASRTGHDGVA